MLGDEAIRQRAREIGAQIREEDGVGTAVRLIEQAPSSRSPARPR
jgi:UDP:flavonoid glycosyltransferase YjiC (YdhE family)